MDEFEQLLNAWLKSEAPTEVLADYIFEKEKYNLDYLFKENYGFSLWVSKLYLRKYRGNAVISSSIELHTNYDANELVYCLNKVKNCPQGINLELENDYEPRSTNVSSLDRR